MQSVASRIWTRVAVSISSDDNRYTTCPSFVKQPVKEKAKHWIEISCTLFKKILCHILLVVEGWGKYLSVPEIELIINSLQIQ